jgi:hypothetical protein
MRLSPDHDVKQPSLLRSRGAFLRPGFCIFASLTPIEGGRSAERRSGAAAPVEACDHASKTRVNALTTPHARRLARRLAPHDAGRSPLGAPPWQCFAENNEMISMDSGASVPMVSRRRFEEWYRAL